MRKRWMRLLMVLIVMLMVCMGATASAANDDVTWKTTGVDVENGTLYISGYFTNNRADRVIDRINWFQPNITFTMIDGNLLTLTEIVNDSLDVWIEPGCTYDAVFAISGPGDVWQSWKANSKFNYHYQKIQG